jgi:DNA-binding MarR family transcriptional regulator
MTRSERDDLDRAVLKAAGEHSPNATYVLRNRVSRQSKRSKLTTPQVLRSCRRLEKLGLLRQFHGSGYAVMLVWELTDEGRAFA